MATENETPMSDEPVPEVKGELYGVLAEFASPGALVHGAAQVRDAGFTEFDAYSPFPVHGIDPAIGIKRTILPVIVFLGGFGGLVGGTFLQWWMNAWDWPWNVAGKPAWSIPANVPISYETTILASVLTTFFGMWILNKLPQVWHPFFKNDRFARATDDGFFLGVEAKDAKFDLARTSALLEKAGAVHIEPCYLDPEPITERRKMPRWMWGFIIATTVMAMIPLALIARARASKSTDPHYHIFPDMDFQPRAKSDAPFDEFPDGRANRGEIAGTVARGLLRDDDPEYFYGLTGAGPGGKGGTWVTGLPARIQPTPAALARGQERFNVYCAPCHGYDGQGRGTVPAKLEQSGRIWAPANLTAPTIVVQPNGQLFNTISNGRATMLGYASQITVEDRWDIVLYVRALQRSQHPSPGDAR
jgi:mono/diheme cytochrome c family protein